MERRDLDHGIRVLVATELESRGFLVAYSERSGGVSHGAYESLNLGFRTGDEAERVRENRRRLVGALGVPPFAAARQVHGASLVRVGEKRMGAGFDDPGRAVGEADVLAVSSPGLPVAVFVADCVPMALASPEEHLLVAVHAGWRGLASGILDRALPAFERPSSVRAAIGPAIGPCHYEVGEDVALAVASGSDGGAVTERRQGRLFLDLPGTVARVLRAAGVRRIERTDLCTACQADRFFSFRRDGQTGRQAMVALRT